MKDDLKQYIEVLSQERNKEEILSQAFGGMWDILVEHEGDKLNIIKEGIASLRDRSVGCMKRVFKINHQ